LGARGAGNRRPLTIRRRDTTRTTTKHRPAKIK
jgi:hypothetical protein